MAGSLPRALRELPRNTTAGLKPDVRLVLPFHSMIQREGHGIRFLRAFSVRFRSKSVAVRVFMSQLKGVPVYLMDASPISQGGSVYSSDASLDGEKYAFFSLAALELPRVLNWRLQILHANDWHTALAVYSLLLRQRAGEFPGVASVLTVHNLAFTGPRLARDLVDSGKGQMTAELPRWGRRRPLPLGLCSAGAIVAVSPTYALEIQTAAFGVGLQRFLRQRRASLQGILNGIDVDVFNPALDPALHANFDVPNLARRVLNKTALQARLNLPVNPEVTVLGAVTRLDPQKGSDLVAPALRRLRDHDWQAVVLGTGHPTHEAALRRLQKEFPDRVRVEIKFDDALARQIYGGADLLLMPSRYEPCGLAQMIAMRYGCIPVVSAVGGLRDTVVDGDMGIVMGAPTSTRLASAVDRAIKLRADMPRWSRMQRACMSHDFSWAPSARRYFELYKSLLPLPAPRATR